MPNTLNELGIGIKAKVVGYSDRGPAYRRLLEMGVTPGTMVEVVRVAPLGDPLEVRLKGYNLALRRNVAALIEVE